MSSSRARSVQFGDYLLTALLGKGATARVYRAYPLRGEGVVAVKALHPDVFSLAAEQAMEREAQLAKALGSHPNLLLPTLYKRIGAQMVLILPHVDGWTLKEILALSKKEPRTLFPPSVAVDILIQVCRGLQLAHGLTLDGVHQNLVHRDLKPGNIMVERGTGVVKILDFGVAKFRDRAGEKTREGVVVGTPLYFSPEQLASKGVDARSDLFALGTILFEVLSGRFAFDAPDGKNLTPPERFRIILKAIHKVDPSGRDARKVAEVEARLQGAGDLLAECWAKDPSSRLSSADMFKMRLQALAPKGPSLADWLRDHEGELPPAMEDGDFGKFGPPSEILPDDELGKTSLFLPTISPLPSLATLTGVHVVPLENSFVGVPFGRYELLCLLGAGAQGKVYLARTSQGTLVVLKVLHPDLTDETDARNAFENEARLGALLQQQPSSHVVQIFPVEQIGGHLCLPMRYIRGWTLDQLLYMLSKDGLVPRFGEKGLPIKVVIDLMIQIVRGVGHIHGLSFEGASAQVVHRDLKPANIMVSDAGEVKILDFGVARMHEGVRSGAKTAVGITRGTPAYMSPEQVTGRALDGRSDLFAIGTILYELLLQKQVFPGQDLGETMREIMAGDSEDLRAEVASVSPELANVFATCHARDREERFHRAGELKDTLELIGIVLGGVEGALARFVKEQGNRLPPQIPYGFWGKDGPPSPVRSDDRVSRIFKVVHPDDISLELRFVEPLGNETLPPVVVVKEMSSPRGRRVAVAPIPLVRLPPREPPPVIPKRSVRPVAIGAGLGLVLGLCAMIFGSGRVEKQEPVPQSMFSEPLEVSTPTPSVLPSIFIDLPTPAQKAVPIPRVVPVQKPVDVPVSTPEQVSKEMPEMTPMLQSALQLAILSVNANVTATVFLDGERLGDTPLSSHDIPPGVHTLRIECASCGALPKELTITAESGKRIVRVVTFSE